MELPVPQRARLRWPSEQLAYAGRVRALLQERYAYGPKAYVHIFGCQQNVADGERIKGMLAEMGYAFCEDPAQADLILFDTCAVRGHAENRVFGNLGACKNYKRRRPNMLIGLCGCMVQQPHVAERLRTSFPYVDLVFGTHVQHRLPEFIYRRLTGEGRVFELSEDEAGIVEQVPVRRDSSFKAFLPVMYGCNNFCTYCVVPYVRGRERSRRAQDIVDEAAQLAAQGFKEIMLLGQNVNSYGADLPDGIGFPELLRRLNAVEGDFVLRFMTSHPKDCTDALLDAMRDCEKVEKHLHLPVQSGSTAVLKRMNRRYTREEYLARVEAARARMPSISLTSDVIVGFPGETQADFEQTLSLVEQVRFTSLFTFLYSPRAGTPAAAFPDPVAQAEKRAWFSRLLLAQEPISKQNHAALVGQTHRVLCEGPGREEGRLAGRTNHNFVVEFRAEREMIGQFTTVCVERMAQTLEGRLA